MLNPFYAKIVKRYILEKEGSSKITKHIEIDLENSGITYKPGDDLGVIPLNYPKDV